MGKLNRPGEKIIDLEAIVLHWLATPNQKPIDARNWWESEKAIGSAQYIIGTDGLIMQTLPEDEVGWQIGSNQPDPVSGKIYTDKARVLFGPEAFNGQTVQGLYHNYKVTPNFFAVGIEMSHLNMEPGDFSEATLQSAVELVANILRRHNKPIDIVTTHHEIVGWKDCPRLWTNYPSLFEAFKERVKKEMEAI